MTAYLAALEDTGWCQNGRRKEIEGLARPDRSRGLVPPVGFGSQSLDFDDRCSFQKPTQPAVQPWPFESSHFAILRGSNRTKWPTFRLGDALLVDQSTEVPHAVVEPVSEVLVGHQPCR